MENRIKEDYNSSNMKQEEMNNSESERFKSSRDQKVIEISTREKYDNEEKDYNIEKSDKNENHDNEDKQEENQIEDDAEEEILEINDDNLEIEKKTMNIKITTAGEVLKETNIAKKENYNLLKINLNFLVKKEFKWVVYRTPVDTIKFFKKLYKSIKHDENAINLGFVSTLEKLKGYKEKDILNSIEEIKNELDKMIQSSFFKNNLLLNEFFNIGGSSFSQYNDGIKPFEGWGEKKADPHCMRKAFGYICKCLECCIFKQYNQRWIVLKDDMILILIYLYHKVESMFIFLMRKFVLPEVEKLILKLQIYQES